jgi:alpha-ketoglutarate-dependent taurine dioxygenase
MDALKLEAEPRHDQAIGATGDDRQPSKSSLTFERLDGPFGVIVRGITWERPDPQTVIELTRAMRRHLLLVFRGQLSPDHEQLETFFGAFGRLLLQTKDGTFHYNKFSKDQSEQVHRRKDGNYLVNTDKGMGELVWHNDQFHKPQLKTISVLEAIRFDEGSVPTSYRDMYTAYEMLPFEDRARLEHKQSLNFDPRLPGPDQLRRLCDSMHPIFTAHPESGRRALYISDMTTGIAGMEPQESDRWMAHLRAFAEENAPRYDHPWQATCWPGTISACSTSATRWVRGRNASCGCSKAWRSARP